MHYLEYITNPYQVIKHKSMPKESWVAHKLPKKYKWAMKPREQVSDFTSHPICKLKQELPGYYKKNGVITVGSFKYSWSQQNSPTVIHMLGKFIKSLKNVLTLWPSHSISRNLSLRSVSGKCTNTSIQLFIMPVP